MYNFSYSHAKYIVANDDLIFVKKLNLTDHVVDLVDNLDKDSYPWLVSGRAPYGDFHNGFIKVSSLYDAKTNFFIDSLSENLFKLAHEQFLKIDPAGKLESVERGFISWSHTRTNMVPATPHCDSTKLGDWTFLIHLKGSSGDTLFYKDGVELETIKTVKFEPTNIVIFPSVYRHQGLLPVDTSDRYIVNLVARIDTVLNEKILLKSPAVIQQLAESN